MMLCIKSIRSEDRSPLLDILKTLLAHVCRSEWAGRTTASRVFRLDSLNICLPLEISKVRNKLYNSNLLGKFLGRCVSKHLLLVWEIIFDLLFIHLGELLTDDARSSNDQMCWKSFSSWWIVERCSCFLNHVHFLRPSIEKFSTNNTDSFRGLRKRLDHIPGLRSCLGGFILFRKILDDWSVRVYHVDCHRWDIPIDDSRWYSPIDFIAVNNWHIAISMFGRTNQSMIG